MRTNKSVLFVRISGKLTLKDPLTTLALTLFCNYILISIYDTIHFHPARPQHRIPVPLKSGLTNFSDSAAPTTPLTFKEKFSAGIFCFFLMPKRKSLSAAVSRGKNEPLGKKGYASFIFIFIK
ncbi:hypothetical protein ACTJKN_09650 [Pedobacter sp. 22163]|uniref:hypothetical protein n=1 Tax=Pedobacter sp. 22163 TaxID=3453883 RepID=UPI003F87424D